jgi:hypothetical protein
VDGGEHGESTLVQAFPIAVATAGRGRSPIDHSHWSAGRRNSDNEATNVSSQPEAVTDESASPGFATGESGHRDGRLLDSMRGLVAVRRDSQSRFNPVLVETTIIGAYGDGHGVPNVGRYGQLLGAAVGLGTQLREL